MNEKSAGTPINSQNIAIQHAARQRFPAYFAKILGTWAEKYFLCFGRGGLWLPFLPVDSSYSVQTFGSEIF
jgi:hypothetical protein